MRFSGAGYYNHYLLVPLSTTLHVRYLLNFYNNKIILNKISFGLSGGLDFWLVFGNLSSCVIEVNVHSLLETLIFYIRKVQSHYINKGSNTKVITLSKGKSAEHNA